MTLAKNTNLIQAITKIEFQKSTNVDSIETYQDDQHVAVIFNTGFDWEEIYHSPGTADFSESQKSMTAGVMYDQKLKFKHPGENESNLSDLYDLEGTGLILKITFSNGKSKIVGTIGKPAYIIPDYKADDGGPDLQIAFERQSPSRAPWLHNS